MKLALLTLIIFCCSITHVFADPDPCHKSTEGTDFWFGFMENRWYYKPENPANIHYVEITVTAREATDFTVTYGPSETVLYTGHVSANNYTPVVLNWNQVEARGTQNIENKAVHVTSIKPVNVYAYNYVENSSDVAVIYPTSSLGNEYYTMCYDPHFDVGSGKNSEFLIVAIENGTRIKITPSKVIDGIPSRPAGKTFEIVLNKGQMYQAQSENVANAPGQGDLTGSHIVSNHPIALFSGALATTVPKSVNDAWDHLYEQMPPIQSWGREFYTVPLKGRGQSYYRILAADTLTIANIETIGDVVLQKGIPYEFPLNYNQPARIYSNKKILVAQYSPSNSVDAAYNNGIGDPSMIILSPVSQTVNDVTFVAYNSNIIQKTYVNIVSRTDQIANLLMDESPAFRTSFLPYKNGIYSYAQIEVPKGTTHRLRNTDPKAGFLATVYGFGYRESFGYGVGFNLDIHVELGADTIINGRKTRIRCFDGDSLTLDAGYGFDNYHWSTGAITQSIKVADAGTYWVNASLGGCNASDTVNVIVNQPVLTLGNDTVICNPDTIQLDAGAGWKTYLWSTKETTQKITPKTSGAYSVQVTNLLGCKASGSINVTFDNRPSLDLTRLDTLYCGTKSALLDISADKGTYTLERPDIGTVFPDLTAVVPEYGSYPFKFTATDPLGCYSDTTFKLGFHKIPTVDFSIDSTTCYHYNLSARYIGDATINGSRFTWVFGGNTIADGIGIDSDTIPLGVNQNKRDLSLKVTEEGCFNSFTIKDIKVIPNLKIQIVDSLGCQPFKAEFIAVNSETVTYDWDFGDGTSERSNDHPFHIYPNDGYYNVKLMVTTPEGCTNEVVKDSTLYVAPIPTVSFTLDPAKCLDLTDHAISYLGSGNTNDTYNWDLSGFDPEEIIQNPGTTQGPFVFNLKNKPQSQIALSIVTKYGCKSDTGKIPVKRKPSIAMSVSGNKGCIPLETTFMGAKGDLVDQLQFTWDYGDGTTGTGQTAYHTYNVPGSKYNIALTAFSNVTGCSDKQKIDTLVFVYPKPTAEFSVDHPIVYNDKPDVVFDNQSLGAVNYFWEFGDGTTSVEENPSHKYQAVGYQKVLLQAYSEYNCMDTVSHEVLVAFSRIFPPNAFSPNAPNEIDREYMLASEGVNPKGYHLVILSRWDDIVFETKNEIKGWDGRMKNGDYAPTGNYVWILNFTDFLGRSHRQTGTVTLVY